MGIIYEYRLNKKVNLVAKIQSTRTLCDRYLGDCPLCCTCVEYILCFGDTRASQQVITQILIKTGRVSNIEVTPPIIQIKCDILNW